MNIWVIFLFSALSAVLVPLDISILAVMTQFLTKMLYNCGWFGLSLLGFFCETGDMKSISLSQPYFNALFSSFPFKQTPQGIKYCGVSYCSTIK